MKCCVKDCDVDATHIGFMFQVGDIIIKVNLCDRHLHYIVEDVFKQHIITGSTIP